MNNLSSAQVAELIGVSQRRVNRIALEENIGTRTGKRMRVFSTKDVEKIRRFTRNGKMETI